MYDIHALFVCPAASQCPGGTLNVMFHVTRSTHQLSVRQSLLESCMQSLLESCMRLIDARLKHESDPHTHSVLIHKASNTQCVSEMMPSVTAVERAFILAQVKILTWQIVHAADTPDTEAKWQSTHWQHALELRNRPLYPPPACSSNKIPLEHRRETFPQKLLQTGK